MSLKTIYIDEVMGSSVKDAIATNRGYKTKFSHW